MGRTILPPEVNRATYVHRTNQRIWDHQQRRMDDHGYDTLLATISNRWCWACGRGDAFADIPDGWFGPWLLERSHICNKPRRMDWRSIVVLCSLCHKAGCHHERFTLPGIPRPMPTLEVPHLLWIKRARDFANYDRNFLRTCTIRKLPQIAMPPRWYVDEYARRRERFSRT